VGRSPLLVALNLSKRLLLGGKELGTAVLKQVVRGGESGVRGASHYVSCCKTSWYRSRLEIVYSGVPGIHVASGRLLLFR